jgi:hypothetical protein
MIRPGPDAIAPGAHPGGIVLHVYSATAPPVLLITRRYSPADPIEDRAALDAAAIDALDGVAAVCLVAFDGDTGERYTTGEWFARSRA